MHLKANMDKPFFNLLTTYHEKIKYLTWVSKQNMRITYQIQENLIFIKNNNEEEKMEYTSGLYSIVSWSHCNYIAMNNDNKLMRTCFRPRNYVCNIKTCKCSCMSFKYNNYKINGSCKHVEHYCKINKLLLMISLIKRELLYGVNIPIKRMIEECLN